MSSVVERLIGQGKKKLKERPPGLNQHVLTVLVFQTWVLLLPRLPPSSRSLRLFPWASILLNEPSDICLDLLPAAPLPPVQKRHAQHMFLQHRGAHAEKHININKCAGLSRDWVGVKKLFMCFFFRSFLMGEKKHINKIPPNIPGQCRENFVYMFCALCVCFFLFAPNRSLKNYQYSTKAQTSLQILIPVLVVTSGNLLAFQKVWVSINSCLQNLVLPLPPPPKRA